MPAPLVSVITPTFNQRTFLARCIESVRSQSLSDWEQIVIDDGSTDGTDDFMKGVHDDRIRYIRQGHAGIEKLFATYNKALRECRAPLIAILEGDDFWPQYKLATQLVAFRDRAVVLSYGDATTVNQDSWTSLDRLSIASSSRGRIMKYLNSGFPKKRRILLNDPIGSALDELIFWNFIPAVTAVFTRNAIESVSGFKQIPGTHYVDYPAWLSLSLLGKFRYFPQNLGFYRRHPESVTMRLSKNPKASIPTLDLFANYALGFLARAKSEGLLSEDLWYLQDELERRSKKYSDYVYIGYARRLLTAGKRGEADAILAKLRRSRWAEVRLVASTLPVANSLKVDIVPPLMALQSYLMWLRELIVSRER